MNAYLAYCETCQTEVTVLGFSLGTDEDGRSDYEIVMGDTAEDEAHLNHDLSHR